MCLKHTKVIKKVLHPLEPNLLWFLSDKNNFCRDQKITSQDNRWLAVSPKEVPRVMHTKFKPTIMAFLVISSGDDVVPPFFPEGLGLHTNGYTCVLGEAVQLWIHKMAAGKL